MSLIDRLKDAGTGLAKRLVSRSPLLGTIKPLTEALDIPREETFPVQTKRFVELFQRGPQGEEEQQEFERLAEDQAMKVVGFIEPVRAAKVAIPVQTKINADELREAVKLLAPSKDFARSAMKSLARATKSGDKDLMAFFSEIIRQGLGK